MTMEMASPFLFSTKTLPDERFMPEVGNGHVATVIFNRYVHLNGLYNGEASASSRARIPSLVSFKTKIQSATDPDETYVLNVRQGIFRETKIYENSGCILTRETFAHRQHPSLLITRLQVTAPFCGEVSLVLENLPATTQLVSDDIEFAATEKRLVPGFDPIQFYYVTSGLTKIPEVPGLPQSPITMAWYSNFALCQDIVVGRDGLDFVLVVSIANRENGAITSLLDAIESGFQKLRVSHISRWIEYWENGRIDVDPEENFALAQTLYSTLYYLLTSLPNYADDSQDFIGLSPGGLAHGAPGAEIDQDYLGHCFWDTEMWMFPPILFFHPEQARMLIEARLRTLEEAIKSASAVGKRGAKFPWESALTGRETTPWKPAADYEIHVTGDIAFAIRQFLYSSADKGTLVNQLQLDRLVEQIAAWWQSSVVFDNQHSCSLNDVMGPDEYHYPVNNSAFTNYIAKLSLGLPSYVLGLIGKEDERLALWTETAEKLSVPTAITSEGKEYHPEFQGFNYETDTSSTSQTVKQADVILLGYPLEMQMSREIRQNDLDIYRKITDPRGPAMTWSMFAVGYLEVKRKADADTLFGKYSGNSQLPFGVWSEVDGGGGAVNFLTGMGGFIQSVINGYGGFRLRCDHLAFDPAPLPGTTKWSITGAKYLGFHFNFDFDFSADTIAIRVVTENPLIRLVLQTDSGRVYSLKAATQPIIYAREKSKIRAFEPEVPL